MIKKIKSLFKKPSFNELIQIEGHRFEVIDPAKLPNIRRIPFFLDAYKRDWGIDKNDLLSFLAHMKAETQFPETDNIGKMNMILAEKLKHNYSLINVLESILKEDYQYKPFLKAASYIILSEGENPNKIDASIMKHKMELCQQHPAIEAFFLTTIFIFQRSLKSSLDMSKPSSWYPSKNLKLMESIFYKKMNTTIYEIGNT